MADLEDLSDYHFDYDDDLTDQKIKEEVLRNKEWLMCELEYRDLAYALELAYEKAEDKKSIISISHRKIGWTEAPFRATKNLKVQFRTNFGYGKSSYFYVKLRFKEIDIIPFSEWVKYRFINYKEIMRYSQSYVLENQNWKTAMEYVRDAINLCIEDELGFIEKYLITECKWLITGLKEICNVEKPVTWLQKKLTKEGIE